MRAGVLIGVVLVVSAAACGGMDQPPVTGSTADTADQIGYGVTTILTNAGVQRMRLNADSTYGYDGPQRYELFGVDVIFYSPEGRETSHLVARRGSYNWKSGDMEARDDVVVTTPDGRRLETSILQYKRRDDRIIGPARFHWTTQDQDVIGEGFTADPELRDVRTQRVRGDLGTVKVDK